MTFNKSSLMKAVFPRFHFNLSLQKTLNAGHVPAYQNLFSRSALRRTSRLYFPDNPSQRLRTALWRAFKNRYSFSSLHFLILF